MTENTENTTAAKLSKYRTALVDAGFTAMEIQTLVVEAGRKIVSEEGLCV